MNNSGIETAVYQSEGSNKVRCMIANYKGV
jgi:hypothetical protein